MREKPPIALRERIFENKKIKEVFYKKKYFDFVCKLREWCYEQSCRASKEVKEKFNLPAVEQTDIEDVAITATLYRDFKTGSDCGGTAWFLAQLYNLFELEATIYNFGLISKNLSHVVTIVNVPDLGIYSIQDAYFNVYYIYNDRPANFLNLSKYTDLKKWNISCGRKKYKYILVCSDLEYAFLRKEKIKYTWKEAEKWFNDIVGKYNLSVTNFYELFFFPINYIPISEYIEKPIIDYLKELSHKYNTNFKLIKNGPTVDIESLTKSFFREIKQLKLEKIKTITLYGFKGYGKILLKCLKKKFNINIIDGNKFLEGYPFRGVSVRPVEDLSILKSDLIIVCSITHEDIMIKNIKRLCKEKIPIITIKSLLHHK